MALWLRWRRIHKYSSLPQYTLSRRSYASLLTRFRLLLWRANTVGVPPFTDTLAASTPYRPQSWLFRLLSEIPWRANASVLSPVRL
jgi:hypothetical protein